MNGWEFKKWMPARKSATCSRLGAGGLSSPGVLKFFADGGGDDGIFFIQKKFAATDGPISFVGVMLVVPA
jgi:hypothetical protein